MIDQRFAVFRAIVRVNGLAGLLVGKENVLILVDDVELRDADGQIGVFLLRGVKKLVVDIKLDDISGGKMGIALGALSVQLDALETDVFLHQRIGEQRHGLRNKTVKTLACVVLTDGKLFHGDLRNQIKGEPILARTIPCVKRCIFGEKICDFF